MNFRQAVLLSIGIIMTVCVYSQASLLQIEDTAATSSQSVSSKYLDKVSAKANSLNKKLDKQTTKALQQWQKQEARIKRKLAKIDSVKAAAIFGNAEQQYKQLEQKLQSNTSLPQYISSLDTLGSFLKFLQQNPQLLSNAKEAKQKLSDAVSKVNGLESSFQKAEKVEQILKERKQYFKDQLGQLAIAKELKKMNKQAYYFGHQLNENKAVLKDRKKVEKKAIEVLAKTRLFKEFMRKNGQLAGLFRLPDNNPALPNGAAMTGLLQSRAQVQNALQNQSGMAGLNPQQRVQQGLGQAQSQLNQMKQKVQQFGGNSSDVELPDFQPNSQRGKSFLKKIEVSANVQSSKHNNLFPVTSDVGLSLGFKPSDKIITGIGGSYRLGWGTGFKNIRITHQGVGVRSFIDIKAKGRFFISGGYEQNYYAEIRNIEQLKDNSAWKSSALLGLSKKYKVGKKKNGEIKLLYDFFCTRKTPRTQPLLFRVGFGF